MNTRSIIAFLVGVALYTLVPYLDPFVPGGEILLIVLSGLVVGAAVVLIAGDWRAWWLALASALVGALIMSLLPPAPGGFETGLVAFSMLYAFAFLGPAATVGALLAGAVPALAGPRLTRRPG